MIWRGAWAWSRHGKMTQIRLSDFLFIFQGFHQGAADGAFGGEQGRSEGGAEDHRDQEGHDAGRKLIGERDAGEIVLDHLQLVIKVDRAGGDTQDQADGADGGGLHPHGAANLVAQAADGPQDAELPPAVGDRHGERVDDSENGDQHGDDHLKISEAEPLVHDLADVLADFAVGEHEQVALFADAIDDTGVDGVRSGAPIEVDAEDVHGVVLEGADVDRAIDHDGAHLVAEVANDTDDRQAQGFGGGGYGHRVAQAKVGQRGQVLREDHALAFRRQAVHGGFVAGDHVAFDAAGQLADFDRDEHDGQVVELDARHADGLHLGDAGDTLDVALHRGGKVRAARSDVLGSRKKEIGIERVVHPFVDRQQASACDAALADHQREREHERGDGRGSAARRLDQAVGGEGAFHGAQPAHGPTQEPGELEREKWRHQQSGDDQKQIAGEKHRAVAGEWQTHQRQRGCNDGDDAADATLAGAQDLVFAFLQRLDGLDPCGVTGGNQCGDHAGSDAHRYGEDEESRVDDDVLDVLRDAEHGFHHVSGESGEAAREGESDGGAGGGADQAGDGALAKEQRADLAARGAEGA